MNPLQDRGNTATPDSDSDQYSVTVFASGPEMSMSRSLLGDDNVLGVQVIAELDGSTVGSAGLSKGTDTDGQPAWTGKIEVTESGSILFKVSAVNAEVASDGTVSGSYETLWYKEVTFNVPSDSALLVTLEPYTNVDIATRYGTRYQLEQAVQNLTALGMDSYYDVVFNHRMGASAYEEIPRDNADSIYAWTQFDLPGRQAHYTAERWGELYHDFSWDWRAFNGTDYYGFEPDGSDMDTRGETLFAGKAWPDTYGDPYLMGADVDYWYRLNDDGEFDTSGSNWAIRDEMQAWGRWIVEDIGFAGFRMDATAHVNDGFIAEWVHYMQHDAFPEDELFFVAEAWVNNTADYLWTVDSATHRASGADLDTTSLYAFDFGLRNDFAGDNSLTTGNKDMTTWGGMTNNNDYRGRAVTFADNHDTSRDGDGYDQPQITNYKNQAYAYMLMREHSTPTVYARDWDEFNMADTLRTLIQARRYFAYGDGVEMIADQTGDANTQEVYGYARLGDPAIEGTGLWMLISGRDSGGEHTRWMNTGMPGKEFVDLTGNRTETVTANGDGWAEFSVNLSEAGGWSVWVRKDYAEQANFPAVPADQVNRTIYQFFYWDAYPGLWGELANTNSTRHAMAEDLAEAGVTAVWLPPAAKALHGTDDVGYGVSDFWDLGEF